MRWSNADADESPKWMHLPDEAWPVYALLVYMLRRSDQLATSLASRPVAPDDEADEPEPAPVRVQNNFL
jgi:hypothetical protein